MKIIPLLFLLISTVTYAQSQKLKKEIKQITAGKNATVAISVLNLKNNKSLDINGDLKLPMLSVFKLHIALAVLNAVDQGNLYLDQVVFIKKEELLPNTWSPIREKFPNGNIEMSLAELIKFTVANSDNNGCDILLRLIGGTETVQKFISGKGIRDFQIKFNEEEMHKDEATFYKNFTTTNSANEVLKRFFEGKMVSKTSTDFLMKVMTETSTGKNKIVAQLPTNIAVAHKTGSSGKNSKGLTIAENDIGIVTLPNGKHYAISIFVSDSMETEAVNTKIVADISKIVFDYFSEN